MGVGVGSALAGGIGALIGHNIDKGHINEAQTFDKLAGDVLRYNPQATKDQLLKETQNTYNTLFDARETHDLDQARVVDNNIDAIRHRVEPLESEAAKMVEAYGK